MNRQQPFFDDKVTLNKLQDYRSRLDDDSSGDQTSGTYAEMVEEVEKVSEMLMKTQSKLWKSQDEVKSFDNKTKALQSTLDEQNNRIQTLQQENADLREKDEMLRDEIERLNQEISDRDEGRARPELEKRLRKAIEFLNKDLETARQQASKADDEVRKQKTTIAEMKKSNDELVQKSEEKEINVQSLKQQLTVCQKQLREATEGSAYLVEEVAKLRDELHRTKKIVEQKDIIIRREVEGKVKEKIKHDVRQTVTQQVTEKVTREVTSKMKAEREKELGALREQIKRIVRENAMLKSQIDGAHQKATEANTLEQEVVRLNYEVSRYESLLDEAQRGHELDISKLETNHRMAMQCLKEEAAKEKWVHAAEIRKQMTMEREREVDTFTQRIEALSKQADRLLQRAEKEKEEYGAHIKKRISEEKQREILSLKEKLEARTNESEELLQRANRDKEEYAEQVRKEMREENRREVNKITYRIEVLTGEKEALQKRIDAFEEELTYTWKENESHVDQIKLSQSDIKALEDEIFKLKRKNQNYSTLVNRYKTDSEEALKELKNSKQLFREALLKSEEQNFKLKAKLKKYEPMVAKSKEQYSETLETLEQAKSTLSEKLRQCEEENAKLSEQNSKLLKAREEQANNFGESGSKEWFSTLKTENSQLKMKISNLETTLQDANSKVTNQSVPQDVLQSLNDENARLKISLKEMGSLLQEYKEDLVQSKAKSRTEIENLKEQLREATRLLEQWKRHRSDGAKDLDLAKQMSEGAMTVASEDDTVQLNREIQTIEQMLEMYKTGMVEPIEQAHKALATAAEDDARSIEIDRLKAEIEHLTSLLENQQPSTGDDSTKTHGGDTANFELQLENLQSELEQATNDKRLLEDKLEDLNYLLEKYRNELSKTSKELENTRQTLALEGETAQQLNQRVQSLNLLLETTEQNHAEHSRELEQSHRRFNEATNAAKREIERLNDEIKKLRQQLTQSQLEMKKAQLHSDNEQQRLQEALEEAEDEKLEWKSKLEALESELQEQFDQHSEMSKELKHSKRVFNEALIRSEKEIVQLRHQIEILAQANADYVEASHDFETTKQNLEQSLLDTELSYKRKLEQMESVLNQTKDENVDLLKRINESEKDFRLSLQVSQDEKNRLRQSLDDVKRSLQVPSPESDASRNHTRVKMEEVTKPLHVSVDETDAKPLPSRQEVDRPVSPVHSATTARSTAVIVEKNSDDDSDEKSARVISRLDDLFGEKKKKVTWKDSDWDIDTSTVTSHSHSSRAASSSSILSGALKPPSFTRTSHSPSETPLAEPSFPGSELLKIDESESDDSDDGDVSAQSDDDDGDDFADVTTFEEAIRRSRMEIKAAAHLNFIDTFHKPERTPSSDSSSLSTTVAGTGDWSKLPSARVQNPSTDGKNIKDAMSPRARKFVRWNLPEDRDQDQSHASVNSVTETESREASYGDMERPESRSPDDREQSDHSAGDRTVDSDLNHPDHIPLHHHHAKDIMDDDSTLDWNIQHNDDASVRSDSTRWTNESSGRPQQQQQRINAPPPSVDRLSGAFPVRLGPNTNMPSDSRDDLSNMLKQPPVIISRVNTYPLPSLAEFSYSSSGSSTSSDETRGFEGRQPTNTTVLSTGATGLPPAKSTTLDDDIIAPSSLRQRKKSGFQRALEKASRRNWTKQELTQFLSTKKIGRMDRMPSAPIGEDQPYDEQTKETQSQQLLFQQSPPNVREGDSQRTTESEEADSMLESRE